MKTKKLRFPAMIFAAFLLLTLPLQVFAADSISAEVTTPTGWYALLTILPLIVILVLLFLKVDMIAAGLVGGVMAMIIGGISLQEANQHFLDSIPGMLSITVPIINSAVAMAVFKSGGYTSALTLVRRGIKGRVEYFAAFIVLLQAAATYMSGIGGGSAMVIAPLAFAALGAIPEVIAAMSIVSAVSFTTSPASLESGIVSKLSGIPVADYVAEMRLFTLGFVILGIAIAFWGAKRRKALFVGEESSEYAGMNNKQLFKMTIPAVFLLASVILGPMINKAIGYSLFTPLVYTMVTVGLIFLCTKFTLNKSLESMVDGSTYILTRLFSVGIFLAFINMIGQTGAFAAISSVAAEAPSAIVVPVAVLAGILVGIPAGAYVGSILTLVLPIAVTLGFSPMAFGFVAMGVGLGSQLSFVNITMQALSSGFQIPILQVVKGNGKWVGLAMVILLVLSLIFG
ncbi:citrate transporter [Paenibacillus brevis]|uniref:Citrate transporter n=1 Tax=Paenibacillus brevis TaxID=2841508 RepID=A0ABS6FVK6_9BACL|nr:citrate transporter [Paenibacillus brevis]MBU5674260.1 citrate transporter [Paenibacillus brevis]